MEEGKLISNKNAYYNKTFCPTMIALTLAVFTIFNILKDFGQETIVLRLITLAIILVATLLFVKKQTHNLAKKVYDHNDHLIIIIMKKTKKKIMLAEINEIIYPFRKTNDAQLNLKNKTISNKFIRFTPASTLKISKKHPYIEDLIQRVDKARQAS